MNNEEDRKPLFLLGRTTATRGSLDLLQRAEVHPRQLLDRHRCGDWGELSAEDRAANERAIADGARVISAYVVGPNDERVWVISEADRSSTTILLPFEY
ncbi:hypothetical protein EN871_09910 [bacterium M00.F.Ca.ET.228.01.1.1]|nr:hypothetical protein EN871_09910 [bacterium M00.F.Ca.ET.228.01.1.1]TGS02769.1 hypothetical protein EN834_09905 [bacterium M00.F.Ca.ET.191.01.1.1]TGU06151.1 hypothetical protein EN798_13985 [bacterium M00.F.Ca.ET.155.01.1.1]